jgi:hypothetical protein
MNKYYEWINENFNRYLSVQKDELSKSIVALFLMSAELKDGGGAGYLDREASDYLPQVRDCFKKYSFQEGLDWIDSLEKAYGMSIHPNLDSREKYIFGSNESDEVQDRLDKFNMDDLENLEKLIPKVDQLLDKLVQEKLVEQPNWE